MEWMDGWIRRSVGLVLIIPFLFPPPTQRPPPPAHTHTHIKQISDDYTLKILGGLFTNNSQNDLVDATVDVEGGTLYCHRCHFTENEGTAIKATGADSLVGLRYVFCCCDWMDVCVV
jgi:hypothetical protein